jgi:copper chaperone NosL
MKVSVFFIAALLTMLQACGPKPVAIRYGEDKCVHCQMSIVDPRFGCELVTSKGKVYKFDAVECMVNYLQAMEAPADAALLLTNTWDEPGVLLDVNACVFLQSNELPSPMGMYLNPFHSENQALETQSRHGGKILRWDELKGIVTPF